LRRNIKMYIIILIVIFAFGWAILPFSNYIGRYVLGEWLILDFFKYFPNIFNFKYKSKEPSQTYCFLDLKNKTFLIATTITLMTPILVIVFYKAKLIHLVSYWKFMFRNISICRKTNLLSNNNQFRLIGLFIYWH